MSESHAHHTTRTPSAPSPLRHILSKALELGFTERFITWDLAVLTLPFWVCFLVTCPALQAGVLRTEQEGWVTRRLATPVLCPSRAPSPHEKGRDPGLLPLQTEHRQPAQDTSH